MTRPASHTLGTAARLAAWLLLGLALWAGPARATLIAELSQRRIDISTGFTGAEVLVFGTIDGGGDVIVVVRGPAHDVVVRRKVQMAGAWVNGPAATFQGVPSFYAVAATAPLASLLPGPQRRASAIGIDALPLEPRRFSDRALELRGPLVDLKREGGLWSEAPRPMPLYEGRLFFHRILFPATVYTGAYRVTIYHVRQGEIVEETELSIAAERVGLGASVWTFANRASLLYGVVSVLLAVSLGWFGSVVFRRG